MRHAVRRRPVQASANRYPAAFTFDPPEAVANWRPLVNWFLVIPQLFVGAALRTVSQVLAVRTSVFTAFLREEYPPFEFAMTPADPGGDRVHVDVQPQLEQRNRLSVGFRLILAIPQLIALALLSIVGWVVLVVAFFAVLFTARWPAGLRTFTLGVMRWWLRVEAYLLLLTDEYPPYTLD